MHDVNQFFSLWFHRSRVQPVDEIETQIKITGEALTKDEQEILELKGALFVREDGKIAPRHLTGFRDSRPASLQTTGTAARACWVAASVTPHRVRHPQVVASE